MRARLLPVLLTGLALVTGPALVGWAPVPGGGVVSGPGTAPAGISAADLPVLDSRMAAVTYLGSDARMQVDLNDVTVSGDQMRVTFTARNLEDDSPVGIGMKLLGLFHDRWPYNNEPYNPGNLDGVYVLDTAGAKRYLPGRTVNELCACSAATATEAYYTKAGTGLVLSAIYAAPPADTRTVDVSIPNAGTFAGIEVNRTAPAPAPVSTSELTVVPPHDEPIAELPVQSILFPQASGDGAVVDQGDGDFRLAADVLFEFDRSDLTPRATEELARIAEQVGEADAGTLAVVGHTDDVGDGPYNEQLSQARAESVRAALSAALGPGVDVTAAGRGEAEPIADNATDEGRVLNRRVDIQVG